MPSRRRFALVAFRLSTFAALAVFAGGCVPKGCRADNSSGLPSAQSLPSPTYGTATVAGRVSFEGDYPEPTTYEGGEFCGPIQSETVVGVDGGLGNVLVYLKDAPLSTGAGRESVTLDQTGCRFEPHVLAVQVGQPVEIKNGDPVRHNVHYQPERNTDQNFAFEATGQTKTTSFPVPEEAPVTVKCDVHPWMTAYLGIFAHPFYAVTDLSGHYAIEQVPAGEYELVAWHELYGTKRSPVVVADAGTTTADFLYARP